MEPPSGHRRPAAGLVLRLLVGGRSGRFTRTGRLTQPRTAGWTRSLNGAAQGLPATAIAWGAWGEGAAPQHSPRTRASRRLRAEGACAFQALLRIRPRFTWLRPDHGARRGLHRSRSAASSPSRSRLRARIAVTQASSSPNSVRFRKRSGRGRSADWCRIRSACCCAGRSTWIGLLSDYGLDSLGNLELRTHRDRDRVRISPTHHDGPRSGRAPLRRARDAAGGVRSILRSHCARRAFGSWDAQQWQPVTGSAVRGSRRRRVWLKRRGATE